MLLLSLLFCQSFGEDHLEFEEKLGLRGGDGEVPSLAPPAVQKVRVRKSHTATSCVNLKPRRMILSGQNRWARFYLLIGQIQGRTMPDSSSK